MTRLTPSFSPPPVAPARSVRAPLATAASARLTTVEEARIADAFPARPTVAQKLYGADRQVQQARPLGARLDLSA